MAAPHKGIEGLTETLKNLDNFGMNLASCARTACWRLGGKIMTEAKRNCAKQFEHPTGRLMGSITMKSSFGQISSGLSEPAKPEDEVGKPSGTDPTVVVGTNVKYAPYVEFGHVARSKQGEGSFMGMGVGVGTRVEAKPYLYPAFFANENDFEKTLIDVVKRKKALQYFNTVLPILDPGESWE